MSTRPTGFPLGKPIRIAEEHSGPSVYDTPFDSVAEACATIAEGVRGLGLTVKVLIAGKVVEYWWEAGKTDADLVQKVTGSGGGSTGGSTIQTIEVNELSDLDNLNLSENLYIIKGGVKGQLIVVDDEAIQYLAELSDFYCVKGQVEYTGSLANFSCVKELPLILIEASHEAHAVIVTADDYVASDVVVGVKVNGSSTPVHITIANGTLSNTKDVGVTVTSAEIISLSPEFDTEYDYYFATLE